MPETPYRKETNMSKNVTIDGVEYAPVTQVDGEHVLIRSRDAGVFVGRLVKRTGDEVELADARRIWYWDGAATLSQLATEGTSKPNTCKFPPSVPSITVLGVCEVISVTAAALASIAKVKEWRQ